MVSTLLTEGQAGYATIANTVIADYHNDGVNWSTELRAFGIDAALAGERSIIANNYVSNNDVGIGVFEGSGCYIIDHHNKLTDNRFFGIMIADGEHTVLGIFI